MEASTRLIAPPLFTVTLPPEVVPIVPVPASAPPLFTLTAVLPNEPLTTNFPALIVVVPS